MNAAEVIVDPEWDDSWYEGEQWIPEPSYNNASLVQPIEVSAKKKKQVFVKPSQFVSKVFYMPNEEPTGEAYVPFSFEGREHLRRPYDSPSRRILLCCGRQVEKSTLLGNVALSYSCMVPALRTLYVSPSATQAKTFSNDRIKEPIETSPILRRFTNKMLSQNMLEKQFTNRAKITLRYAYLNADRCVTGDTRVFFTDGSVATVKEVYDNRLLYVGKRVWSANPTGKNVKAATLTDAVYQGKRETFKVRLTGGAELECTDNQPLLTWEGWKELSELVVGDFVATPRMAAHGAGTDARIEEFKLVGYLLGDGSVGPKAVKGANLSFHNSNAHVLNDFAYCLEVLGLSRNASYRKNGEKTLSVRFGGAKRNPYKKRLKSLGVLGSLSTNKRVPREFFKGSQEQVATFLRAIYSTDGWASVSGTQYEVGYCSNSRGLLVDLQHLLLRFGITSCISAQKKPSTANAQGAFVLSIRSKQSVLLFCTYVGIVGKQEQVDAVAAAARTVQCNKDDYDRVPLSYKELRTYLRNAYGLSTHGAWKEHRIQLRPGNAKDSIGRRVLHTIGAKLGDNWLLHLAASPLGWSRIESIEAAGTQDTYDLSIESLENYMSDGVFVHNTRGIPAEKLFIDEIQDILKDNIPVIEHCTSHARDRWKSYIYAGTPKSIDNIIEDYRANRSTQGEWVVPCEGCNHWNILGEKNIGKKGPICEKCGKIINPQSPKAQWAWMVKPDEERVKVPWESYRIPQLMVPWKIRNWYEVLYDYENHARGRFYNECLGISFESGMRPITSAQIRECCLDPSVYSMSRLEHIRPLSNAQPFFAGLDWGTGDNAYTVLTLGTYVENKFRVVFMHRFTGEESDPEIQIAKIIEICRHFNVALIGADHGFGFGMNSRLVREFGRGRVHQFQYMARMNAKVVYNNRLFRWQVHRTEIMSAFFDAIKAGKCEFPPWEEFHKPFAQDFLNIYSEYNEKLRMIMYDHTPGSPDDSYHSFIYTWLVSMILISRPDIITPNKEDAGPPPFSGYTGPLYQG